MLVAGTALSLIAPLGAQASDINIEGMNSYVSSKSSSKKQKKLFNSKTFSNELATIESKVDSYQNSELNFSDYEAGVFSNTTVADQKLVFTIAAADHDIDGDDHPNDPANDRGEGVMAQYSYTMNLNSSFTGDDNLYIRLKAGNAAGWLVQKDEGGYLSSSKSGGNALGVDKIWYTFPVGERHTVWIGPRIENYYMHATTPSLYSPTMKQFTLGGNAAAYGASTNSGIGYAYKWDDGLAFSTNVVSKGGPTDSQGFATDESSDSWATQIGYTKPQYSISAIVNFKTNGWIDEYFSTQLGQNRASVSGSPASNSTNYGLRAWFRPEESGSIVPSISLGYDLSTIQFATEDDEDTTDMYFVGLGWADIFQADDKIGFAMGQPQQREDETSDPLAWEAYYSFKANDYTEYRTTFFGGTDRNGTAGDDITGVVLQTTFKY